MILQKVIILNYQSCRKVEIDLQKDAPTILIGINDGGKSRILQAIGLLLNPSASFSFQKDVSAKRDISNTVLGQQEFEEVFNKLSLPILPYTGQQTCVLGRFLIEKDDLDPTLTTDLSNHLLWSIEKSADSSIWLAKAFDTMSFSQEMFLLTPDVSTQKPELQELWHKKSAELKSLRTKNGVTDIEVQNANKLGRFTNLEQVRPLLAKEALQLQWHKYPDFKKDVQFFPQYRYLSWDFTLDDLKKIANDAMKSTIDKHTALVKKQADSEAASAESDVNNLLSSYVGLLQEDVPTLKGLKTHMYYDVKPVISDILMNKINADQDIHLDSQGEGIKRQLWFGLIRIAANQATKNNAVNRHLFIWCFDEPETHLYPAAQRRFFDALKDLAKSTYQVVLSSHSTVFTDRSRIGHINNAELVDGYTVIGVCQNVDDVFNAIRLRNSDFLFYDKFLLVEGDTESILIPHCYELITNRSLADDGIQIMNLGSKNKRDENIKAIRSVLNEFRKPNDQIVLLLDGDAKREKLSTAQLKVTYVGKQDLEDSISADVWMDVLKQVNLESLITQERLKTLLDGIKDEEIQHSQKFLPLLRSELMKTEKEKDKQSVIANFPQKGLELGTYLANAITKVEQIPGAIAQLFPKPKAP